jgi:hypothetical protein
MVAVSRRTVLVAAVCLIAVSTTTAWFGASWLPMRPLGDDGPFSGRAATSVPPRPADQVFDVFDDLVLEVYDSSTFDESVIVSLCDKKGQRLWAIYADGHSVGDTRSVRFTSFDSPFLGTGIVRGRVKWTFGDEACHWYITRTGRLCDYWYSW